MSHPRPGPANPVVLTRGLVLGGCRLEQFLDTGGMGQVWHAHQLSLDRPVAVKVLSAELARDAQYIDRFKREATLAAKIRSPFVIETYDAAVERGVAFIVMELLSGWTLEQRIQKGKPLTEAQALHVTSHVARGLAAAHDLGLVHRDIKPANIFIQKKGHTKILDFGLVHAEGEVPHLTDPGTVMGTPYYMSPEQCVGGLAGPASDLYSLGASIYAALTGGPPFKADHALAVLHMHLEKDPRPLRELRPDTSPRTESLVRRLMAKDPKARPPSAKEAAHDAERVLRELAGSPAAGTSVNPSSAPSRKSWWSAWGKSKRMALGALGVAVLSLAALGWLLLRGGEPGIRASEAPATVTRFYTLSARIIPEGPAPARSGVIEIEITPKPGLMLSSAHGESHGHQHKVAEYGIDISPSPVLRLEKSELTPPEIRTKTVLKAKCAIAEGARPGKYPLKIVHRYQAGEIGGSHFEPERVEIVLDVLLE